MKKMQLLRRKPKSVWVVDGRDDIFWQKLLNKKSPDWYFDYQGNFFLLHEQLFPYIATVPRAPTISCKIFETNPSFHVK